MQNKFGNEIKVVDLGLRDKKHQVLEANIRHLQRVRDRYRKYKTRDARVKDNTLRAEQLCQLAQWKNQISLMKERI